MIFYVKNNRIVEGPLTVYPKVVTGPKGVQYPLRELAAKGYPVDNHGWVEYTAPVPNYNPNTHKLGDAAYSVVDGEVTGEYAVIPLTAAELAEIARRDAVQTTKGSQVLKNFLDAGPDGIETYITNNVTDLASAKQVLTILGKIVWVIADRQFDQ